MGQNELQTGLAARATSVVAGRQSRKSQAGQTVQNPPPQGRRNHKSYDLTRFVEAARCHAVVRPSKDGTTFEFTA